MEHATLLLAAAAAMHMEQVEHESTVVPPPSSPAQAAMLDAAGAPQLHAHVLAGEPARAALTLIQAAAQIQAHLGIAPGTSIPETVAEGAGMLGVVVVAGTPMKVQVQLIADTMGVVTGWGDAQDTFVS